MAWTVDIDGTDITSYCQQITWRPKLSRPASLVVRVPGHLVSASAGTSEMHLSNGGLLFSGPVWYTEVEGDENATYLQITAYDHLIYLNKRMCKSGTGYGTVDRFNMKVNPGPCNLADPTAVILDNVTAPEILAAFINATNDCDGSWNITVGSVSAGGPDMTGLPADWPMNVQTLAEILLGTGQLNILVNPGYGSSSVNLTNGGVVNDLSGSVAIQYQTGAFNSQSAQRSVDMEEVINALWYLLGPKRPWNAQDIAHWAGSITPTAPNAGPDGDGGEPGPSWPAGLVARWMGSRGAYGYMQEIQVHDTREDEQTTARPLFEEMFANEAYLRAVPRTFVGIKPERASGSGVSFGVGDLISVSAGSRLAGGYSGALLVYEYEINIDADGVAEYTDIIGSPDGQ